MDKIIRKQAETAATNIQKVVRGVKVRKQLPEIMEEADRQAIIKKKIKLNNVPIEWIKHL